MTSYLQFLSLLITFTTTLCLAQSVQWPRDVCVQLGNPATGGQFVQVTMHFIQGGSRLGYYNGTAVPPGAPEPVAFLAQHDLQWKHWTVATSIVVDRDNVITGVYQFRDNITPHPAQATFMVASLFDNHNATLASGGDQFAVKSC